MAYAYVVDDERISEEFTNLKELFSASLEEIIPKDWVIFKDPKGEYIYLEVVETETVDYEIDGEDIIHTLMSNAYGDFGDDVNWYLEDVNIEDFDKELNKFWKNYKERKNIKEMITEKNNTTKTYKVYFKEVCDCSYELVDYVEESNNSQDISIKEK